MKRDPVAIFLDVVFAAFVVLAVACMFMCLLTLLVMLVDVFWAVVSGMLGR